MNTLTLGRFGLVALLALPLGTGLAQQNPPVPTQPAPAPAAPVTTNEPSQAAPFAYRPNVNEVVKLSGSGMGADVVAAFVAGSPGYYHLSASDILKLKDMGIPQGVIMSMLNHDAAMRTATAPEQVNYGAQPPNPNAPEPAAPQPQQPAPTVIVQQPATPALQVSYVTVGAPDYSDYSDYYYTPGYWGWNGGWCWIGGGWGYRGWGGYHGYGGYHGGYGYHAPAGGFHGSVGFRGGVGGGFHGSAGGGFHGGGHR